MRHNRVARFSCVLAVVSISSVVGIGLGNKASSSLMAHARAEAVQKSEVKKDVETRVPSKLFRVRIAGNETFSMSVEVLGSALAKMPGNAEEPKWDVISYRPTGDRSMVEHYELIGIGYKVSDVDLAVEVPAGKRRVLAEEQKALTSTNPAERRALLFIPRANAIARKMFANTEYASFVTEAQPVLSEGGFVAFPIEHGVLALATSCKCKGFFGGTSGCSQLNNCKKIIAGFCQSDTNCKATDSITSCSCQ